jgi:hypothetical protein
MRTTTSYTNQFTDLTQNTASSNSSRGLTLVNDSLRYLTQKYFFNEQQYQTLTQAKVQVYTLPFDAKDIINMTVLVGGILWQPLETPNRQFWDALNTIPFYSDFPQFSYRFKSNQIQLFPTPTSSGDPLQINYKRRIPDLSSADYVTGTVSTTQWKLGGFITSNGSANIKGTTLSYSPVPAINDTVVLAAGTNATLPTPFVANTTYYVVAVSGVTNSTTNAGNQDFTFQLSGTLSGPAITATQSGGIAPMQGGPILSYTQAGNVVTGSGTSWTTNMAGRWLNIPETQSNTTSGDNGWYQILSVQSSTSLTLYNDYQGQSTSGASYVIGEVPILPEDYQDLALWRALWIYYTSIVPNLEQAEAYLKLYETGKEVLDYEFGSKSTNPVLTPPNAPVFNPNLFPRVT